MQKIYLRSLVHSIGAAIYIAAVALLLNNSEKIFGKMTGFLAPVTFLLVFTLSALIVGTLLLGKPLMLYFDGKKKEAISMLSCSIGWLALFTVILLIILATK